MKIRIAVEALFGITTVIFIIWFLAFISKI